MRVVSKIDAEGLLLEDVLLEDGAALPPGHIEERTPPGFHRPKWTGSAWTEGMTGAEILANAKSAKRDELARAFVGANTALYPEVEDAFSIWLAVPEYAADPNATRPTQIRANIAQLRDRLAAVEAATTVAGVEAVAW